MPSLADGVCYGLGPGGGAPKITPTKCCAQGHSVEGKGRARGRQDVVRGVLLVNCPSGKHSNRGGEQEAAEKNVSSRHAAREFSHMRWDTLATAPGQGSGQLVLQLLALQSHCLGCLAQSSPGAYYKTRTCSDRATSTRPRLARWRGPSNSCAEGSLLTQPAPAVCTIRIHNATTAW